MGSAPVILSAMPSSRFAVPMGAGALARVVVAVDGTAGSGKSTTSRRVAQRLGLRYLDTGALYRAVTWAVLEAGVRPDDEEAVVAVAERVGLDSGTDPAAPTISVDGRDVSREIRSDEVTAAVSRVSAWPQVRRLLLATQVRRIGSGGIVVEGRDIGTVVAPDADVKVFLTADPTARATRRAAELTGSALAARGVSAVAADLERRDSADAGRAVSPLAVAADAVTIDTTALSLDEVVAEVVGLVRQATQAAIS